MLKVPFTIIFFFFLISGSTQDKTDAPIDINWVLDEAEWIKALEFRDFKQLEPSLGETATEDASSKVLLSRLYMKNRELKKAIAKIKETDLKALIINISLQLHCPKMDNLVKQKNGRI